MRRSEAGVGRIQLVMPESHDHFPMRRKSNRILQIQGPGGTGETGGRCGCQERRFIERRGCGGAKILKRRTPVLLLQHLNSCEQLMANGPGLELGS